MFTRHFLVIFAFTLCANMVPARELEKAEINEIFTQLTSNPQKTWLDSGTIKATHTEYRAAKTSDEGKISEKIKEKIKNHLNMQNNPVRDDGLKKLQLDAIPFNVRYQLSNEYTMVTENVMKFSGEKFHRSIDVISRTDSVKLPKNMQGNIMTDQFRPEWNGSKVFAYDGEKFSMYIPNMDDAIIDAADKFNHKLGGEAAIGIIPWGYGYFTLESLLSMECSAQEKVIDGIVQIVLNFGNFAGNHVIIALLPNKDYAVASCITKKDSGITINKYYSDHILVSQRWVPQTMVFEKIDNNTNKTLSTDLWQFTQIIPDTPPEYEFAVNLKPDTSVEFYSHLSPRSQQFRNSSINDAQSVLADRLEYLAQQDYKRQNCATASLKFAAKQLGINMPSSDLESIVDTNGTSSLLDIKRLAEINGLTARAVKMSLTDLQNLNEDSAAILYLPGKQHFVIFEDADSEYVRVIDLVNHKFNYRIDADFFDLEWDGTALVISQNHTLNDFQLISDSDIALIKGDAGYDCNEVIQEESIFYCDVILGECAGVYQVFHKRWGCIASQSGTCNEEQKVRYQWAWCVESFDNPWGCVDNGNYTYKYMQACE